MKSVVKRSVKGNPVASFVIALLTLMAIVNVSRLIVTDGREHPGYVTTNAVLATIGILILLKAVKVDKLTGKSHVGMGFLAYFGFWVLGGIVLFVAYVASYGKRIESTP
jgi:uncharacterized membrane protein